jgi:hypothetical protein
MRVYLDVRLVSMLQALALTVATVVIGRLILYIYLKQAKRSAISERRE